VLEMREESGQISSRVTLAARSSLTRDRTMQEVPWLCSARIGAVLPASAEVVIFPKSSMRESAQ